MGMKARVTPEHALGRHAKVRPKDHGACHPELVGLGFDQALANTQGCLGAQLGTTKQTLPLEQCIPKSGLEYGPCHPRLGWTKSNAVIGGYVIASIMAPSMTKASGALTSFLIAGAFASFVVAGALTPFVVAEAFTLPVIAGALTSSFVARVVVVGISTMFSLTFSVSSSCVSIIVVACVTN
ncbi:hypothetical protein Syun_018601 [Stephania yunnanensis]|uniref:Uncharacterized protein n=1 Tax=Stephania yunnanensis TaxID=152371 RepID=A0AAP0NWI0_9MAGN